MVSRKPIVPERVRRIAGQGFSFLPHCFLREGFFASLTAQERDLYFFLVIAGDRNGISFYHYDTICSLLGIHLETYIESRRTLIEKDLIAFDGTRFQVLSLPDKPIDKSRPLTTGQDFEDHDPATIARIIVSSLAESRDDES